ncbi:hypothetical protein GCM10009846_02560 [Agrococcus versicolor]|uniref:DUF304 domain-containing protein n=1 Tax=Agrococcus versicolor TaxID=501482 RepID=A0ABN3AKL6_9MICO
MITADDTTLAARPEQFELAAGPQARLFRLMAVADAILFAGVAIAALTVWQERALGIAAAVLVVVAPVTLLWVAGRVRAWRLRDGRPLANRVVPIAADPDETFERLATGDPAIYTPIQLGSNRLGPSVRTFSDLERRVTYVVVTRSGSGSTLDASPILELHGEQHDALLAALARGLGRAAD